MANKVDENKIIGEKYGRMTITAPAGRDKHSSLFVMCKCECGNVKKVRYDYLRDGRTRSCGCLQRELFGKANATHRKTKTRLYKVWDAMKYRCYREKCSSYKNYGGRGIRVCDEWKNSFESFYEWAMNNGYDENAKRGECTLDRIDCNGNYEPDNCRWANARVQSRNKRSNVVLTKKDGESHVISDWSEITGLSVKTITTRYRRGYSVEKILYLGDLRKDREKTKLL